MTVSMSRYRAERDRGGAFPARAFEEKQPSGELVVFLVERPTGDQNPDPHCAARSHHSASRDEFVRANRHLPQSVR
jgi:hypothetical protein